MNRTIFALACGLLWAGISHAQVAIQQPWVRSTVPGQKVAGAFMVIESQAPVTLVGAASPAARTVEIHESRIDGSVMKMRQVERIEIPAGKAVELKPGGYHVMLIDIVKPLSKGEIVPLSLTFEQAGKPRQTVKVDAPVRDVMAAGAPHAHH